MYITTGKIAKTYGVAGHVKAVAYSDQPERYLDLKVVYVDTPAGAKGFIVENVEHQSEYAVLKLKGINSREDARDLVGCELLVPEKDRIELNDGDYFIHDLLGLKVFDTEDHYLGELVEVLVNAGNDIYVVRDAEREYMIPAVYEFVKEIDLIARKMCVELIEGM